jgi:endonuclease-3
LNPHHQDIFHWFAQNMPVAETELHYGDPFQLLVATILSAQCTDKRVNLTTPLLFAHFPDAATMAKASVQEIYELIKSVSYPNNKAKHLAGMAQKVMRDFGGAIPDNPEELQTLPGVGRKTANVVASVIYKKAVIAVDTHVFRVSHRLGLSQGKTPEKVEYDLNRVIQPDLLPVAHHWLILHGRYVCTARKPHCHQCGLVTWCPSVTRS